MYEIKVLSNKEFDSLPESETRGSDISDSLGFANKFTGKAYVRQTGIHDLNKYLINHELEELESESSHHEDENGIRHKKGGAIKNFLDPIGLVHKGNILGIGGKAGVGDSALGRIVVPAAATLIGGPLAGLATTGIQEGTRNLMQSGSQRQENAALKQQQQPGYYPDMSQGYEQGYYQPQFNIPEFNPFESNQQNFQAAPPIESPIFNDVPGPQEAPNFLQQAAFGPIESPSLRGVNSPVESPNLSSPGGPIESPNLFSPSGPIESPNLLSPGGPIEAPNLKSPGGPVEAPNLKSPGGPIEGPQLTQPSGPVEPFMPSSGRVTSPLSSFSIEGAASPLDFGGNVSGNIFGNNGFQDLGNNLSTNVTDLLKQFYAQGAPSGRLTF